MKKAFTIACLLGLAFCAPKWHELDNYTFDQYVRDFKKDYAPNTPQYNTRKAIFEQKLAQIKQFNSDPSKTYKQGINRYSDLAADEFKESIRGISKEMKPTSVQSSLRSLTSTKSRYPTDEQMASLPESVDWRKEGVVSPVKDQGHCGSCWAFSSTAVIESHAAINSGHLKTLSTQQLVSCMGNPYQCGGEGGCAGAVAELAFNYAQLYGMTSEYRYSYSSYYGDSGVCTFDQVKPSIEVEIDGYIKLPANDYNSLLYAVATEGPIVISVDASNWHSYESGVFNGCDYNENIDINHAVVLEGYGTDPEFGDYWLVRNSWGTDYGENGYIRIARESEVQCGVDSTPEHGTACLSQFVEQQACGQCGILFDSAYPLNARVVL